MRAEPVAVAFANTRSSAGRDRIDHLDLWRAWSGERPGLRTIGLAVDSEGLRHLRAVRDEVQAVLRATALAAPADATALGRTLELAGAASPLTLRRRDDRYELAVTGNGSAATAVAHHLARAAVDLLVTGPALTACAGQGCLKVFTATRAARRWCDGSVCGNRARVRAHHQRHSGSAP
ncbi:CGNR zinc finger domain-containing protein [Nocardiopsis sp. N85]|uniref:CGNR zinc finger domain-containing protein n=1 Tax=Nocardiopsis sp. N85 TaxID=3029400 RepID=UPI00237F42F3|nr:CGNR zinc finger domain-containing protein [Nocardiopsis sp. N85]MDE3720128.1 CGNR zinc finger domain-containing protein [Nocardiopsis sp. N85]